MHCDLHLHSNASDGTATPSEVVQLAKEAGLEAMALTDHDTLAGVAEAQEAGQRLGVRVVAGVELSLDHKGTFHLIGLGVDPSNRALLDVARTCREGRPARNRGIVEKLRGAGIDITLDEVEAEAGDAVVGRPHIASVLLAKGVVSTLQEAFDRYLAKGAAAYVDRPRVPLPDVVAAVRGAGGATVLCHPFTLGYRNSPEGQASLREFLQSLVDAGVDAVEARYGSYTRAHERRWDSIAAEFGLLRSGGSDFHGTRKPETRVGVGRGKMRVPLAWLDALLERGRCRT